MKSRVKRPDGVRIYNGENWEDYKVEFQRYLRTVHTERNYTYWDVITGTPAGRKPVPAPEGEADAAANRAIQDWETIDADAYQLISCVCEDSIRAMFRLCLTAHDAWKKLESGAASQPA